MATVIVLSLLLLGMIAAITSIRKNKKYDRDVMEAVAAVHHIVAFPNERASACDTMFIR
ncbi:MAG TPA: hypothetical protein IAC88_06660 [Candidatus Onthosoma merdavium]|nr:hypothetical protein [Candidatus Onthosoma merdavium]